MTHGADSGLNSQPMEPLTLDDVIPLEEFADQRREFLSAHLRYVDRYRRVRLGPKVTLVFENRQTIWFRLQEVLRLARLTDPHLVRQELELFNRLIPPRDRLQASLLIQVDESRLLEELAPWRELHGEQLTLHLGGIRCPANLLTCRPEDQCLGAAHLVQFVLDDTAQFALQQRSVGVHFCIDLPDYRHDSGPLSDDVRRSLLDDLRSHSRESAA